MDLPRGGEMTAQDAKIGSVIRTTVDIPPASAGTVGRITGQYFLGYHVHAISVRWDTAEQEETEPTIIPRDHLDALELVGP
jgi:hypothetical protein